MPRPRTVSDQALLEAAGRVLHRAGPAGLTFAAVGAEAGLAPATLVQRYGSKDGLMRAALLHAWDQLDARTAAADAEAAESPAGAVELLLGLSDQEEAEPFEEGLLLLREDFRDPALRARGVRWGEALARALGRRLSAEPERAAMLGRLMASQWQGALIWWGFSRRGTLAAHLRGELEAWCRAMQV